MEAANGQQMVPRQPLPLDAQWWLWIWGSQANTNSQISLHIPYISYIFYDKMFNSLDHISFAGSPAEGAQWKCHMSHVSLDFQKCSQIQNVEVNSNGADASWFCPPGDKTWGPGVNWLRMFWIADLSVHEHNEFAPSCNPLTAFTWHVILAKDRVASAS